MRWLRALVLVAALIGASRWVATLLLGPLLESWHLLTAPAGAAAATESGGLTTLVAGFSAVLLLAAWVWLLAAVGACAWDTLRGGPYVGTARAPSALRPRIVHAVVATFLGATALATPAVHAAPVATANGLPDDLLGGSTGAVVPGLELLEGLPVPDRVTGAGPGPTPGPTLERAPDASRHGGPLSAGPPSSRPADTSTAAYGAPTLQVRPGDSLWTLTAGLLPADAPEDTVARGWRLLYAANRAVVGGDPDLLQPGQSLQVGKALLDLVRSAHGAPEPSRHAAPVDPGP